jgi:phosphoesterase RecJ-like protein
MSDTIAFDFAPALSLITRADRIAIASHVDPDPDAIGSLLGLGVALEERGKQVAFLSDGPVQPNMHFLPRAEAITDTLPPGFTPELFIALDSSDPKRLGSVAQPLLADDDIPTLVIDHHATNLMFGEVNVVIVEAAATAEQIVYLLDALDHPISKLVADCLMAGFLGDTVGFSVSSTTPLTMRLAARLMEAGAEVHTLTDRLFNSRQLNEVQLWGMGLLNTTLDDGVLWSVIPYDQREAHDLVGVSRTRLSNMLLTVAAAKVTVSFSETADGNVDISMRARPGYDVGSLALELGGGGHKLAAGCTIPGPLEQAVERVVTTLKAIAS